MVRRSIIPSLALAYAVILNPGSAAALGPGGAVDWRSAGGGLFVETEPVETGRDDAVDGGAARLPPLSQPFRDAVQAAAEAHGLDPKLLHAVILTESAYRPDVCSPAGACGLTQLMPGTALELGVRDRFDPIENLRGGAAYLARQLVRFRDVRLALAAFNAGPTRVARLGRIPDIAETRLYVDTVIDCYLALAAGRGPTGRTECAPIEAAP